MRNVRWNSMVSFARGWISGNEKTSWLRFNSSIGTSFVDLPVSAAHLTHDAQDRMIGQVFQFTDELGEQPRSFADDPLQVAGHLAGQRQEDIRILVEFARQGEDGFLRGWRLLAALDLAQVRRLDANAGRYPPHGESSVTATERFATLPDVVAERAHVLCSIYYTLPQRQYPPENFRPPCATTVSAVAHGSAARPLGWEISPRARQPDVTSPLHA